MSIYKLLQMSEFLKNRLVRAIIEWRKTMWCVKPFDKERLESIPEMDLKRLWMAIDAGNGNERYEEATKGKS